MGSRYENLTVYKKALELVSYIEKVVRTFDRYYKYTVGAELRNLSRGILILIAKANTRISRKDCLTQAIEKLEELKILLQVCKEIKAFRSFKNYEFSTKLAVDVSKQCEGWFKSQDPSSQKP